MARNVCIQFDGDNQDNVLGQIRKRNFDNLYVARIEFPEETKSGKVYFALKHRVPNKEFKLSAVSL